MVGTRDAKKLADWNSKTGNKAKIGSVSQAAAFGSIVVLAAKGIAAKEALNMAGANNLNNKIVIDVTNPISESPPVNGVIKYYTSLDRSQMEELQANYPKAHFVKAFNSIGAAYMVDPDFNGIKPTMFICGNNDNAKKK
jgi:8-hydroxy-5-deazaflavin:NADPH oxidoreductase